MTSMIRGLKRFPKPECRGEVRDLSPRGFIASLLLGLIFLTLTLAGCGAIGIGSGTVNEPIPQGTLLASGTFSSLTSSAVSGSVQIYRSTCTGESCAFVVRLQSFRSEIPGNPQIVVQAGGAFLGNRPILRASNGSQNYSFSGLTQQLQWQSILLIPNGAVPGVNDYAIANLQYLQ